MKKQQFNCIETKQLFRILGGITDPEHDDDDKYAPPVKDPVSPNKVPNPRTQSRN